MQIDAKEWYNTHPVPEGIPSSASNVNVYKLQAAINSGEAIPANVWNSLHPQQRIYHIWASQKTEAYILAGNE